MISDQDETTRGRTRTLVLSQCRLSRVQSAGPLRQWATWIQAPEEADRDFALHDFAMGLLPEEDIEDQLLRCKDILCTSSSPFTLIRSTSFFFFDELEKHYEHVRLRISQARLELLAGLFRRRMKIEWFVTAEEFDNPWTGQDLQDNAWRYCQERTRVPAWRAQPYVPRFCSRCLVFVHFFSGVQRSGDLQQYLDGIEIPAGCTRVVLSLDIVFDAQRADLTGPSVQRVWLDYIKTWLHLRNICRAPL